MDRYIVICILLGIISTNAIRVVPMLLIKGQIHNPFLRSFLHYVPYVTLAVMTFPSIVHTTVSPLSGFLALLAGIIAAIVSYPVMAFICGREGLGWFFYVPSFICGTLIGGTVAAIVLYRLQHMGALKKMQNKITEGGALWKKKSAKTTA